MYHPAHLLITRRYCRQDMQMTRQLLLCLCVNVALGFKFMSNWKPPTIDGAIKKRQAEAKFGNKKLVVITGTSSGLGRKTARALLRTGRCADGHCCGRHAVAAINTPTITGTMSSAPFVTLTRWRQ